MAWNPTYIVYSQRLESIQRAFTRHLAFVSPGISHRSPYSLRLSFFEMNTLRQRRLTQGLIFLHRLINGNLNGQELLQYIQLSVPARLPRHPIKKIFALPPARTNLGHHAPLARCCGTYNELHLKDIDIFHDSLLSFRRKLLDLL